MLNKSKNIKDGNKLSFLRGDIYTYRCFVYTYFSKVPSSTHYKIILFIKHILLNIKKHCNINVFNLYITKSEDICLKNRSNLEKIIYLALNDINKNGIIQNILKSNLLESYINKAIICKALCLNLPLNYLSKSELQLVVFMINKYYNNKINIDDYFIANDPEKF